MEMLPLAAHGPSTLRGCIIASRAAVILACASAIGLEVFLFPVWSELSEGMKLYQPWPTWLSLRMGHMHAALGLFAASTSARIYYRRRLCCLEELKFNLYVLLLFLAVIFSSALGAASYYRMCLGKCYTMF